LLRNHFRHTFVFLLFLSLAFAACGGSTSTGNSATIHVAASETAALQTTGPTGLPLYCPQAATIDSLDHLYVSDSNITTTHERIIKLSSSGQELGEWHPFTPGSIGTAQGPGSLAVDIHGNLFVIDSADFHVMKISPSGKPLASWGSYGSGPGQFEKPVAVAVDSQDNLYVGDWESNMERIEKFNATGSFIGNIKTQLVPGPMGLAVDSSNMLYVANDKFITKISPSGQVLASLNLAQSSANAVTTLVGVAIRMQGDFYAASVTIPRFSGGMFPQVLKLDLATGHELATWNLWKTGIVGITSITLDSQGNVYVTEQTKSGGMQLQKFSPSGVVLATWQGTCTSSSS
jgi:tripartite motif-containing protein 71